MGVAVVLGCVPLGSSLLLLWLGLKCADGLYPSWAFLFNRKVPSDYQNEAGDRYYLKYEELLMLMYLKVSISDFLTLFCARCRGPFFSRAPAIPLFCAFLRDGLGDPDRHVRHRFRQDVPHVRHLEAGVPGGLGLQPRLLPRAGRGQGGLLQA